MGVADFPVEIFKAFKAKSHSKSNSISSSAGESAAETPLSISRSESQTDLLSEFDGSEGTSSSLTAAVSLDASTKRSKSVETPATSVRPATTTSRGNSLNKPSVGPCRGHAQLHAIERMGCDPLLPRVELEISTQARLALSQPSVQVKEFLELLVQVSNPQWI
jgi:hypothetical protein